MTFWYVAKVRYLKALSPKKYSEILKFGEQKGDFTHLSNYKHWSQTKQDLKEENEISLTEADKSIMKIHNKNYFIIMLDQWMSHLNLLSKFNF